MPGGQREFLGYAVWTIGGGQLIPVSPAYWHRTLVTLYEKKINPGKYYVSSCESKHCGDGIDNDGIDSTDCADDACEGRVAGSCAAGTGACRSTGNLICTGGVKVCDATPGTPGTETCNGIDDNCDGYIDEGCHVPDTGQTDSYTVTFGEDSDYTIHPPSYTKLDASGNELDELAPDWETVRDNVTGLEWVKDGNLMATRDPDFDTDGTPEDGGVTWQHALDYVAKLNTDVYLGHDDWRLPTVKELATIVDRSRFGPAIDTTYFSVNSYTDYGVLVVYFLRFKTILALERGVQRWLCLLYHRRASPVFSYVRAVRGGQFGAFADSPVLENNNDGTVTDLTPALCGNRQLLTICLGSRPLPIVKT